MRNKNQGTSFQIIILVFAVLALGTFLHDPILHSLAGGEVVESQSGFTSGSTTVDFLSTTSPALFWLFYMLPSAIIYAASMIVTIYRPVKPVLIISTILLGLNLGSFDITNQASDSYKAMNVLAAMTSPEIAFVVHLSIFIIAVVLFGLFLYISVENNSKDSSSRIKSILR